MRGVQLFEMVEKRGQPFYLIELKLYLISKSRAKALDLREERGAGISQRRGPLGRRIIMMMTVVVVVTVAVVVVVAVIAIAVVVIIVALVIVVRNLRHY